MRVVVPYVPGMIHDATIDAAGDEALLLAIDPGNDRTYAWVLIALWEAGRTFAIVEQDVVPPPGWADRFERCPNRWCIVPPDGLMGSDWLGCARFRAELLIAHPTLMRQAQADPSADGDAPYTWRKVDIRLARYLRQAGIGPCFHSPPAGHLHDYSRPPSAPTARAGGMLP